MLNRFRHQTVPGRRQQRAPAPLLERDERSDEMMRRITASKRFSFEGARDAVAEATEKAKTTAE
ncbi:hypothetical protein [Variovorax sp. GT1P44]|uniref:hypothetical protein n=1 Tax=Variovorax sp. GT1P44 TaxID=3443742 RepID=UPI003F458BB8